jgi:hypothetical protein
MSRTLPIRRDNLRPHLKRQNRKDRRIEMSTTKCTYCDKEIDRNEAWSEVDAWQAADTHKVVLPTFTGIQACDECIADKHKTNPRTARAAAGYEGPDYADQRVVSRGHIWYDGEGGFTYDHDLRQSFPDITDARWAALLASALARGSQ